MKKGNLKIYEAVELDNKMAKLFMSAKKDRPDNKGDQNYEPVSIQGFQASIHRYLK